MARMMSAVMQVARRKEMGDKMMYFGVASHSRPTWTAQEGDERKRDSDWAPAWSTGEQKKQVRCGV